MLTVDDFQELTVGIDDAPDFGRLPVNIHLKRVMLNIRHVFIEFFLHYAVFIVLRDKEQVTDILPIQPVVEQMGAVYCNGIWFAKGLQIDFFGAVWYNKCKQESDEAFSAKSKFERLIYHGIFYQQSN